MARERLRFTGTTAGVRWHEGARPEDGLHRQSPAHGSRLSELANQLVDEVWSAAAASTHRVPRDVAGARLWNLERSAIEERLSEKFRNTRYSRGTATDWRDDVADRSAHPDLAAWYETSADGPAHGGQTT